ncbi:hypothetical protein FHW58_000482 [Duganella sp. 1224]|uniref:hypothetical protein n=1 Tax=Duganella sp. 1224 TaxID=2587052 RepID=UPI0015C9BFDC|nr:hypothetical protein [Duganella sp. 1224]NYE59330.1 hypothetical protein [Duganella sp. 1224]
MFNLFAVLILERLHGKKLPVLLADGTSVTERTWRSWLGKGMRLSANEINRMRDESSARLSKKLQAAGGYSAEEADAIVAGAPSRHSAIALPTADLIYWFSPGDYTETLALAVRFDQYCNALLEAARLGDVEASRSELLNALDWLRSFCADEPDQEADDAIASRLREAEDIDALHREARMLAEHMMLHVFSCWDVEFNAFYFQARLKPYPLFTLAMPRLAMDIEIDRNSGQMLRRGRKPGNRVFEKSMSRLFDFLAVLVYGYKYGRMPQQLPRVKEMAAWSGESESVIVSWRDETTRFRVFDLLRLWRQALPPDTAGVRPAAPLPMLVAAHLWSPLRKAKGLTDCTPGYVAWWKRNLQRLQARGTEFGDVPWPACLIDDGEIERLCTRYHFLLD